MDMGLGRLQELMMAREPGVLRFMGSQRVGHDWATELNWTLNQIMKYYQLKKKQTEIEFSTKKELRQTLKSLVWTETKMVI